MDTFTPSPVSYTPTPSPYTPAPATSPTPSSVYYFKPSDSPTTKSSLDQFKDAPKEDNLAVPGFNPPTYIIYPSSTKSPNSPSSSTQSYLKPSSRPKTNKYHPAGVYDAAAVSKSIYREETNKYSGAIIHQKVIRRV